MQREPQVGWKLETFPNQLTQGIFQFPQSRYIPQNSVYSAKRKVYSPKTLLNNLAIFPKINLAPRSTNETSCKTHPSNLLQVLLLFSRKIATIQVLDARVNYVDLRMPHNMYMFTHININTYNIWFISSRPMSWSNHLSEPCINPIP